MTIGQYFHHDSSIFYDERSRFSYVDSSRFSWCKTEIFFLVWVYSTPTGESGSSFSSSKINYFQ